jgi:hypothetical protein
LFAGVDAASPVSISKEWLLALQGRVWRSWCANGWPALRHASVVVIDELIELAGGEEAFDQMIFNLIGKNFARAWRMCPAAYSHPRP